MFVFHLLKACNDNEDGVIIIVDQLEKKNSSSDNYPA
jgi:hypothetical protein